MANPGYDEDMQERSWVDRWSDDEAESCEDQSDDVEEQLGQPATSACAQSTSETEKTLRGSTSKAPSLLIASPVFAKSSQIPVTSAMITSPALPLPPPPLPPPPQAAPPPTAPVQEQEQGVTEDVQLLDGHQIPVTSAMITSPALPPLPPPPLPPPPQAAPPHTAPVHEQEEGAIEDVQLLNGHQIPVTSAMTSSPALPPLPPSPLLPPPPAEPPQAAPTQKQEQGATEDVQRLDQELRAASEFEEWRRENAPQRDTITELREAEAQAESRFEQELERCRRDQEVAIAEMRSEVDVQRQAARDDLLRRASLFESQATAELRSTMEQRTEQQSKSEQRLRMDAWKSRELTMKLRAELQEERSERSIASMHLHTIEELRVESEKEFKAEQQHVYLEQQEMHEKVQAELEEERNATHTVRRQASVEMSEIVAALEERAAEERCAMISEYEDEKQRSELLHRMPEELSTSETLVMALRTELCEAELRADQSNQQIESTVRELCNKEVLAEAEVCREAERQRRAALREEVRQTFMLCERALAEDSLREHGAMDGSINAREEPSDAGNDEAPATEAGEEDDASSAGSVGCVSKDAGDQADAHEGNESESGNDSERSRSRSPRRSPLTLRPASHVQRRRGPPCARGEIWQDDVFADTATEDRVVICAPSPEDPSQPRIVFEDGEVIVLYKPPNWTCTTSSSSGARRIQDFLISAVGERVPFIAEHKEAGLAHRLDRDTSGPLVVARNQAAYDHLRRTVSVESGWYKEYVTLVHGSMPLQKLYGVVNAPLEDDPTRFHRMRIASKDSRTKRNALSFYRVERLLRRRTRNGDERRYSLMRFRIVSGRTHQIRLHARHIFRCLRKRPRGVVCDDSYVVGDVGSRTYDRTQYQEDQGLCTRIFLHKTLLQLPRFGSMDRSLHVESPLPRDLEQVIENLEPDDKDDQVQQFNRFTRLSTARSRAQNSVSGLGVSSPDHW